MMDPNFEQSFFLHNDLAPYTRAVVRFSNPGESNRLWKHLHSTRIAYDIFNGHDQGLLSLSGISATSHDECCGLSKMGEMNARTEVYSILHVGMQDGQK